MIVTRFAPSPTGYLHIGGLRTALYAYFVAKQAGGKMILRIEDTDRSRLVEGSAEALVDVLHQMHVHFDGDPVFQSKRHEQGVYTRYVEQLLEKGKAYHCFCSKERLLEVRQMQQVQKETPRYDGHCRTLTKQEVQEKQHAQIPFVIRLRIPEGETVFTDAVRGEIRINNSQVDDQVLIKSDGWPTYHLAVVVDDHDMEVTHVIRGEDWISSTPKHLILYDYFGWTPPIHAHLPNLLNSDRKKLSKRQGDVAVEDFLKKGYLPEALNNFIALLGYNPRGDQEIYSLQELIDLFDLSKVKSSGALVDNEKLDWLNRHYIKQLTSKELIERAHMVVDLPQMVLERAIEIEKERVTVLTELADAVSVYKQVPIYESSLLVWKKADQADALLHLRALCYVVEALDDSTVALIQESIERYIKEGLFQNGNVLWPLRVALSGVAHSPSPYELIWILGREEALRRLHHAINQLGG